MQFTQTGLDSAPSFPIGSTLSAASWHVPTLYSAGIEFDTKELALIYALNEKESDILRHKTFYAMRGGFLFVFPEQITIDFRWTLAYSGGSTDLVASRFVYPTLADAREALALIQCYNPQVPS